MGNNTKKQGEIKTWNEGKPNIVGGSGALGLIGGVAGKAVKMLNFANIRSAIKQYVGKGGGAAQQSLRGSSIPKNARIAAKAKGDMSYLSTAKADKYTKKYVSDGFGGGSKKWVLTNPPKPKGVIGKPGPKNAWRQKYK